MKYWLIRLPCLIKYSFLYPCKEIRARLLFQEYLYKQTSYVGSLHKANNTSSTYKEVCSTFRNKIFWTWNLVGEKNWPIPCQCYCSSTHLTFYFDSFCYKQYFQGKTCNKFHNWTLLFVKMGKMKKCPFQAFSSNDQPIIQPIRKSRSKNIFGLFLTF